MENIKKTNTLMVLFGVIFALVGVIFGLFFDLKIDAALYNPNSFLGLVFVFIGLWPASVLCSVAAAILIKIYSKEMKKEKNFKNVFLFIYGIVAIVGSPLIVIVNGVGKFNVIVDVISVYGVVIISIIMAIIPFIIAYIFIDSEDIHKLTMLALFFTFAFVISEVCCETLKIIWTRPRFRYIYYLSQNYSGYDIGTLFRPFYLPGGGIAKTIEQNIPSDQLKSFPSGHSWLSTLGLTFVYLPLLNKKTENNRLLKAILLIIGIVFMLLTMLSRLIYGAHYLSDISFGALFSVISIFASYLIANKIMNRKKKHD